MATPVVRPLETADVPRLLELIEALADYENMPRPDAEARGRLAYDALANPPWFHVLLAELDGKVVGYAVYYFTYSTFLARPNLYLEDIFVQPDHRGEGAGLALFQACAAEAVRQRCGRMEWVVLDWNAPSLDFYKKLGARQAEEWLPYRLDGEALHAVAS
jgi:GNAT superfamily N-acetyltransferase